MLKKCLIFTILLSQAVLSRGPDPVVESLRDKTYLKLPDGKEVVISYPWKVNEGNGEKVRVFLRKGSKVLWDKTFSEDFGTLWHEAYFIPIKKDQFIVSLNQDSYPEIAIAVWSGGNHTENSSAIIFSVNDDSLTFFKSESISIEFAQSVY